MTKINWKYKAGSPVPGGTIQVTADDVRPNNAAYISKAGSDITGNGSRMHPYRTMAAASPSSTTYLIVGEGFYNEATPSGRIVCDGYVVFNGTGLTGRLISATGAGTQILGAVIDGYPGLGAEGSHLNIIDTHLKNVNPLSGGSTSGTRITRCILENLPAAHKAGPMQNCTAYKSNFTFSGTTNDHFGGTYGSIYKDCDITAHPTSGATPLFTSFHNCRFKLPNSANFVAFATISELRAAWDAFYGTTNSFQGCKFADPKFSNPEKGDFSLSPDSECRNIAFDGRYVGAKGVSRKADQSGATLINCTINSDGEVTVTNPTQVAEIIYPILEFPEEREAGVLNLQGTPAWRNGWVIAATQQLESGVIAAGATLETNAAYLVESGSINYNGSMMAMGSRFTAVSSAPTFSTSEGGVVRKILRIPHHSTVLVKTHRNTGGQAFFDTLTWHEYKLREKMLTNRVGNIATNAITYGNGAPEFDAANALPVFVKFIQVRIVIWANGLKS